MLCKITDPNCTSEYTGDVEIPELGKWYTWEEVMTLAVFAITLAGYGFVYIYYDMVNKKYYVGVCKQTVRKRSRQHYNKTGKLSRMESAIKDVGCNRILVCIVKVCKVEDLAYFENYFMDSLNTMHPNGYNDMKSGYKNIDSTIQEMLSRELPKERLLELLNKGYTYRTIAKTMLPIKVSPSYLCRYGRSLGIVLKRNGFLSPTKIAELSSKGYSNREIAQKLGATGKSSIAMTKRKYNIQSVILPCNPKPVLEIDLNSGVILARYPTVTEASNAHNICTSSLSRRIKNKTIKNGAYLVYEEDYLKQQRSSTQVVEEVSLEN